MNVILVIDTGTSSMRGILFDKCASLRFTHRVTYAMTLGPCGAATMEAAVFADGLREIARACADFAQSEGLHITAISFTSQRSSVAAIGQDGSVLSPFYMWYDKRSCALCAEHIAQHGETLYALCGMSLTPVSSAPKMQWLKNTALDVYKNAYKLMGIHDYLLYLTCGRFVTDASLGCRTALMDIRNFCWSGELLAMFGLDEDKLCELVAPGSIIGSLSDAFARATGLPCGIPIISAGGDQQCGALGQGLYQEGTININTGTASYLSAVVTSPVLDPKRQVNLNTSCYGGRWLLEAGNTGSGILYQWFNKAFFTLDPANTCCTDMDKAVRTVPAGCDGLLCVTDFAGRGCPNTNPDAKGIFANIGLDMGRAHFARAVLEGICFDICEAFAHLSTLCAENHIIQSSGGLTNFSEFNTILADVLGREIIVTHQAEATALGALILAQIALGQVCDPADFFAANPQGSGDIYRPDAERHAMYQTMYRQRLHLKEQVSPSIFTQK